MKGDSLYFTHDTVEVDFDVGDSSFEKDDSGELVDFSLDSERIVTVNNTPWKNAFETDRFFVAPATVAKPIKQKYRYDGDIKTFKKPADELRKSAWSLDNKPFTLGHPSSGRVRGVEDTRGFWRDPDYETDADELNAKLYVPVNDDEALQHISENGDVSVGFSHRIVASDEEDVDGYQTDLYYDHIASVKEGRCSGEEGCGIELNGDMSILSTDGYKIAPSYGAYSADDGECGIYFENDYRDEEGRYYALSPEEGMGEPKYPIEDCSDAEDAWKLRGHGDYRPSQESLERRIKRRASDLGCDGMPWEDNDESNDSDIMTEDCECEQDNSDESNVTFDVASFSIDALKEKNDEVSELYDRKEVLEEEKSELEDEVDEKEEEIESLQDELEEYKQDEREEVIDSITDITETWDEDSLAELSLDELRDRLEIAKDVTSDSGVANAGKSADDEVHQGGRAGETVDPKGNFS